MRQKIVIIGGGAAGFFAAVNLKLKYPETDVCILEKTSKLLSKVLISGGGRCNVTNHCLDVHQLVKNYPRGEKELMQVFSRFNVKDTIEWFKSHGVPLKTEPDNRMFPVSNSSETIANCFLDLAKKLNIRIQLKTEVTDILKTENFILKTSQGEIPANKIIISAGGHAKPEAYNFIKKLGHTIINPIPSLFTINLPSDNIKKELQGVSVKQAKVSIADTRFFYEGPVLITHWGLSGPAVLKLSAFAAAYFHNAGYNSTILVNWTGDLKKHEAEEQLMMLKKTLTRQLVSNVAAFDLPKRLWQYLLQKAGIADDISWSNLPNQMSFQLAKLLCEDAFHMQGKTTFKEEFVTAGGVDLKEIDFKTMESKKIPGVYFCGEVLNIDGITGGFNFQAAWSTAHLAAISAGMKNFD